MNSVRALISTDPSTAVRSSTPHASNQYVGSPFVNAERTTCIPPKKNRLTSSADDSFNKVPNSSRLLTIAVAGLSGFQANGDAAVGKSCLCNRFVRPWEDAYRTDHISTVSAVDFGGRIINNDHWLYWGDRLVPVHKEGEEDHWLQFRIIEQTEFTDDVRFQTFKNNVTSDLDAYNKRCAVIKLHSADKLMYICKDQLGMESDYEQKLLPEGRAWVDGFLCLYDVSQNSPNQIQSVDAILKCLLKLKRPIVLATTKNDESNESSRNSLDQLLNRKDFRNFTTNLVETSSHLNVNIELPFLLLANLIDKSCTPKPKIRIFKEALKIRQDLESNLNETYLNLLSREIRDSKVPWDRASVRLSSDPTYIKFIDFCGSSKAKFLYDQYILEMKETRAQRKLQKQLERLPEALKLLAFDVGKVKNRSWSSIVDVLASSPNFEKFFEPVQIIDSRGNSKVQMKDRRLPADLLYTVEAEAAFSSLLRKIEADQNRKRRRQEFMDELMNCGQVTPGKSLDDVKIFLIGKECYEALDPDDLQMIYDQYQSMGKKQKTELKFRCFQKQLIRSARHDFLELLSEHVDHFVEQIFIRPIIGRHNDTSCFGAILRDRKKSVRFPASKIPMHSPPAAPTWTNFLTGQEMDSLNELLREDLRYRYLNRLHQVRDHMIGQFANFIKYPLSQHCPAESRCIDLLTDDLLDNLANLAALKSDTDCIRKDISLLIIDADGMGRQFVHETTAFLLENEISLDRVNFRFNFDFVEPVEPFHLPFLSDSTTVDCIPDGVVCVFSCRASLEKLEYCLLKNEPNRFRANFCLLLACDPGNLDDLPYLQQRGAQLSLKLAPNSDVPFVGLEPSHSHVTVERRATKSGLFYFTDDQIAQTLTHFCRLKLTDWKRSDSLNLIDLHITVCLMCGDDFAPESFLSPFLKHAIDSTRSSIKNDESDNQKSFCCEMYAPPLSRKLLCRISLSSYHAQLIQSTSSNKHPSTDGFILVYSARRKASFCFLNSLMKIIRAYEVPGQLLICAVGNIADFFSDADLSSLITKGHDLANRFNSQFLTVFEGSEPPITSFTQFLVDVWLKKSSTESSCGKTEYFVEQIGKLKVSPCQEASTPKLYSKPNIPVPCTSSYEFLCQYFSGNPVQNAIAQNSPSDSKCANGLLDSSSGKTKQKDRAEWYNDKVDMKKLLPSSNSTGKLLLSIPVRSTSKNALNLKSSSNPESNEEIFGDTASQYGQESCVLIEPVEVEVEYMTVKDALPIRCPDNEFSVENEAQYATIGSAFLGKICGKSERFLKGHVVRDCEKPVYFSPVIARSSDVEVVPVFVRKCIEFVELEGLAMEGVYRVPGNQTQVLMLEEKFRQNTQISFQSLKLPVNVFTTALKNFFSSLNQPLIPCELYEAIKKAMNMEDVSARLVEVKKIVKTLPADNLSVLKYLVDHLAKVAKHSNETSMDYRNLAKCWWPTLLRPQFDSFESMSLMTHKLEQFVQILLEHAAFVFA